MSGITELASYMQQLGIRYRKELHASPQVKAALDAVAEPYEPLHHGEVGNLLGIEVIEKPEMPPGMWAIIQHDGCEVVYVTEADTGTVVHTRCSKIAEGTLG